MRMFPSRLFLCCLLGSASLVYGQTLCELMCSAINYRCNYTAWYKYISINISISLVDELLALVATYIRASIIVL